MTTPHDDTRPLVHASPETVHRVTDRDAYLVAALELAVMLLWTCWRYLGVDLDVRAGTDTREVSLVAIVLTTTFSALAGYLLLWLLRRRQGLRTWTIIAAVVTLVSCTGPFLATTLWAGVALLSFHLVVGAGLIAGVRRLHRVGG